MLNRDLAELYKVKTKKLNKAININIGEIPNYFMFQITKDEFEIVNKSKNNSL